MSVLLVGTSGEVAVAVVERLVAQGDDVRVVEPEPDAAPRWRALGAHVARGRADDADLLERAAQNVRTIVVLDADPPFDAIVEAALKASVGRIVWLARRGRPELARLRAEGLDYVAIEVPKKGWRRKDGVAPAAVAEVIDAADDLAGNPRLEVDLAEAEGWTRLGLTAPDPT